jgi:hypothetical protein
MLVLAGMHLDSGSRQRSAAVPSVYRLRRGSTALGMGANLAATPYNLDIGTRDYFGNTLATSINIGADGGNIRAAKMATSAGVAALGRSYPAGRGSLVAGSHT